MSDDAPKTIPFKMTRAREYNITQPKDGIPSSQEGSIRTHTSNKNWDENYDRIFGTPEERQRKKDAAEASAAVSQGRRK